MFGQLVRLLSKGKALQYPDEIDPSLWKMAVQHDTPEHPQNSSDSTGDEEQKTECDGSISPERQILDERIGSQNVLLVGWYGPDDPEV